VAQDGDEVAGAALVYDYGDIGYVDTLAVRRPWRRAGVGMALLQAAFGALYGRGQREVQLMVDAESLTGATRLYERAGMRVLFRDDAYQKAL
jgi:mycothiol synthase